MITLKAVRPEERQKLWNIFQKFLYEMTNYYDDPMDEEGNYHYGYFDAYFEEPGREALFLYDGSTLVGFAMLAPHSCFERAADHMLAEFTIFPAYRRRRLGLEAAQTLFARYPGRWEIKYNAKNAGAQALWTKASRPYGPETVPYSADERVLVFTVPNCPVEPHPNKGVLS